jgi:hypothetical protein
VFSALYVASRKAGLAGSQEGERLRFNGAGYGVGGIEAYLLAEHRIGAAHQSILGAEQLGGNSIL